MKTESTSRSPYHPDVTLFLILIPFISAFNYYLTYSNISLSWFLLLTFSIDTAQGYAAWWAVRSFILYLDAKWPLSNRPLKRIAFQLVATTFIGLFVISITTELVSWLARGRPAPVNFYMVDLFIIGIWFLVINGIYVGLYYYHRYRKLEAERLGSLQMPADGLLVRHGKQDLKLGIDAIAGCFVDGEYSAICTASGKKYYHEQSLDKLEKQLPAVAFFRLNRQFLLHRQVITGFKRMENGKLLVLLTAHAALPSGVAVSRTRAPAFKRWFSAEPAALQQ